MVTYLDNSNAKKYHILFDKAANLLKSKQPESLTNSLKSISTDPNVSNDELWQDFTISSLNEYFAYLKDIVEVAAQESTDAARFYVRLPLDEDVFAINANTREIVVPRNFENNGIGVQGDELAEVVYFTIDRFFDMIDLASEDIHIAIQWELTQNGEQVRGFSCNFGKDIESIPGTIIFGWPISHELTETPGTIRFAVRFYSIDTNKQSFKYSLTTLPATVRINPSLDHEIIEKSKEEIDYGNLITSRIKNAGIYNPSMPTPSAPEINIPLHVISPETNAKIVDLPDEYKLTTDTEIDPTKQYFVLEDEEYQEVNSPIKSELSNYYEHINFVKLGIGAQPSDVGVVGYDWRQFPYLEDSGEYEDTSDTISENIDIEYIQIQDDLNPNYQYYIKNDNGYSLIDITTQLKLNEETNTYPFVYQNEIKEINGEEQVVQVPKGYERASEVGGGYLEELYMKISTIKVNTTGIYTADVSARALVNTVTTTMPQKDGITIPGPLSPVITMPADITTEENKKQIAHVIIDSSDIQLTPDVVEGEAGKSIDEVGEYTVNVAKVWQVRQGEEWLPVTNIDGFVSVSSDKNPILTISNVRNEAVDGDEYRIKATSTRNKVSTSTTSGIYRVTHAPVKPEILVQDYIGDRFVWTARAYDSNNNTKTGSLNGKLEVAVTEDNIKTDGISYIWVKANRNDSEIMKGFFKVDLPESAEDLVNNEQYLKFINKINAALGITDTSEPHQSDTMPLRTRDDIVKELNKIASATVDAGDDTLRYRTSFTPTENGIYYCVVINELNNNLAVNVSPFFIV